MTPRRDPHEIWASLENESMADRLKKRETLKEAIKKLTPLEKKVYDLQCKYNNLNQQYAEEYNENGFCDEELLQELRNIETTFKQLGFQKVGDFKII